MSLLDLKPSTWLLAITILVLVSCILAGQHLILRCESKNPVNWHKDGALLKHGMSIEILDNVIDRNLTWGSELKVMFAPSGLYECIDLNTGSVLLKGMHIAKPIMLDLGISLTGAKRKLYRPQAAFVLKVLEYFTYPEQTQVGLMQYGRKSRVFFDLDFELNRAYIKKVLRYRSMKSPGNDLIGSLRDAKDKLFTLDNGARPNISKSLLIFNTKKTGVDIAEYSNVAGELRKLGVKVVVIGIESSVDVDELKVINSTAKSLFIVKKASGLGLYNIVEPVVRQLLPPDDERKKPKINIDAVETKEATLDCFPNGLTYYWYKMEEVDGNNTYLTLILQENNSSLTLTNLTKEDSGGYKCIAEYVNVGHKSKTFNIRL